MKVITTSALRSDVYVNLYLWFLRHTTKSCQYNEKPLSLLFILYVYASDKAFKTNIFLINSVVRPDFRSTRYPYLPFFT